MEPNPNKEWEVRTQIDYTARHNVLLLITDEFIREFVSELDNNYPFEYATMTEKLEMFRNELLERLFKEAQDHGPASYEDSTEFVNKRVGDMSMNLIMSRAEVLMSTGQI